MKRLRVTLVNPKNNYGGLNGQFPATPLGLMAIASVIKDRCELSIIDANVISGYDIFQEKPDIIGISCWMDNYIHSMDIIKKCKENNIPIIIGGPFATVAPQLYLSQGADVVVLGEGRDAIIKILDAIGNNVSLKNIPGTAWMENGNIRSSKRGPIELLEIPPTPFELFPMEKYIGTEWFEENAKFIISVTRLGCNHICKFCCPTYIQSRVSLGWNRAETDTIRLIEEYGINTIYNFDPDFAEDVEWAIRLCDLYKKKQIRWYAHSRADTLSESLITKMADSGCEEVWIGMETASDKIRKFSGKGSVDIPMYRQIIHRCKEVGIKPIMFTLFGMPGETEETIQETFNFLEEQQVFASANIVYPIPQTWLWKYAESKGLAPKIEDLPFLLSEYNRSNRTQVLVNFTDLPDEVLINGVEMVRKHNEALLQ